MTSAKHSFAQPALSRTNPGRSEPSSRAPAAAWRDPLARADRGSVSCPRGIAPAQRVGGCASDHTARDPGHANDPSAPSVRCAASGQPTAEVSRRRPVTSLDVGGVDSAFVWNSAFGQAPEQLPLDALARRAAVAIVDGGVRPIRRIEPRAELPTRLVHPLRHGICPEEVMACGLPQDARPASRGRPGRYERSNGRLHGPQTPAPCISSISPLCS